MQIDVMTEINPDKDEGAKVGACYDRIEVVECLACREKEIADVMGDEDCNTHLRKMETVTEADQCESNDMMENEFLEIFPRLLELKQ